MGGEGGMGLRKVNSRGGLWHDEVSGWCVILAGIGVRGCLREVGYPLSGWDRFDGCPSFPPRLLGCRGWLDAFRGVQLDPTSLFFALDPLSPLLAVSAPPGVARMTAHECRGRPAPRSYHSTPASWAVVLPKMSLGSKRPHLPQASHRLVRCED